MEKERVKEGKTYWKIHFSYLFDNDFSIDQEKEYKDGNNDADYANKNYFHTPEEAEAMAAKLRAVLSGADVIQWPSDKEITDKAIEIGDKFSNDVEISSQYACCAEMMAQWLKSKI